MALEQSGAPVRLRAVIYETLDHVRASALDPALPRAATVLLEELAAAVEGRIP